MEANLCLRTPNILAMCRHKNVVVHSSIRLPALQAKVRPPPGAARVAVVRIVGAGVVLACALGPMYLNRAQALQLPMHLSSLSSHKGGKGDDHIPSRIVSIGELHSLLSQLCFRTSDPKPPLLTELINQYLTEKEIKNVKKNQCLASDVLKKNFIKTNKPGQREYYLGFVLTLALISEKQYAKANEICEQLNKIDIDIHSDARPKLLLAITNMMMAMESMLQFDKTISTSDLKKKLDQVEKAWEKYHESKPDFQAAPLQIHNK